MNLPVHGRGVFTAESSCERGHWHDRKDLSHLEALTSYQPFPWSGNPVCSLRPFCTWEVTLCISGKAPNQMFEPLAPIVQSLAAPLWLLWVVRCLSHQPPAVQPLTVSEVPPRLSVTRQTVYPVSLAMELQIPQPEFASELDKMQNHANPHQWTSPTLSLPVMCLFCSATGQNILPSGQTLPYGPLCSYWGQEVILEDK